MAGLGHFFLFIFLAFVFWWLDPEVAELKLRQYRQETRVAQSLYMVIEHFKGGDAAPVYRRFRERGRLAPPGLTYVSSWVDMSLRRCYQVMETENRSLLDEWIANWSDIVDFEVVPVITSAEAAEKMTDDGEG